MDQSEEKDGILPENQNKLRKQVKGREKKNQFRESDWKSELRLKGGNKRKGSLQVEDSGEREKGRGRICMKIIRKSLC